MSASGPRSLEWFLGALGSIALHVSVATLPLWFARCGPEEVLILPPSGGGGEAELASPEEANAVITAMQLGPIADFDPDEPGTESAPRDAGVDAERREPLDASRVLERDSGARESGTGEGDESSAGGGDGGAGGGNGGGSGGGSGGGTGSGHYDDDLGRFFRSYWRHPLSPAEAQSLCVVLRIGINANLQVWHVQATPVRSSGNAVFDESAKAALERIRDEGARLPEPPPARIGAFRGKQVDIELVGRYDGDTSACHR